MRLIRWTRSSLLASAALLPLPFTAAAAVERPLFTWTSTVDREVLIQIRGRDVYTRGSGLDASFAPRLNVSQALPRTSGVIRVRLENGRGEVDVVENPSPRNDYTATVRVRDSRAGSDQYRIVVTFDPDNAGAYPGDRNDGGWDRNNDANRGRDDDRNRGRDDDRNRGRDDDRGSGIGDNRGRDGDRGGYDRNRRDAGALRWRGLVDDVAEIRIQGGRVDAVTRSGAPLRSVRYDIAGAALPRRDVRVELAGDAGRGSVRVIQQPSMWNNYVAIIRIDDNRPGFGAYDFDVRW